MPSEESLRRMRRIYSEEYGEENADFDKAPMAGSNAMAPAPMWNGTRSQMNSIKPLH